MDKSEIVLYQPYNSLAVEVRLENENIWLTQAQIAELFGTKRPAITKHLNNIYKTEELEEYSTCSILEHMGKDNKQIYKTKYYNLDNYIDESVLVLLSKRKSKVSAQIYTKRISAQLQLDLKKHNAQYDPIIISTSSSFHDRFLIIDNTVYHIGASIKDLGKKLFAFSKMELQLNQITNEN
ncbi:MAG: hypothetical protein FWG89_09345 [Treponema sp.]|nr:hypothetical protein [Treponema sp.]